jgi:hypothetical protein
MSLAVFISAHEFPFALGRMYGPTVLRHSPSPTMASPEAGRNLRWADGDVVEFRFNVQAASSSTFTSGARTWHHEMHQ